jgi:hypothetical protein
MSLGSKTPTAAPTGNRKGWTPLRITAAAAAGLLAVILGIPALFGFLGAWNNVDAGHVAVLRNGGVFSDSNVRGFLDPASSLSYTGIWSTEHIYPAQQRTYTISADASQGDKVGVDVVQTPSSDGVEMGIQGTLYYSLNLDHTVLGQFDNKYGTRSYTENGDSFHAYDGDQGWSAFIDVVVRPILNNDLREQIAKVSCAELDAACALVQNSTQVAAAKLPSAGSNNGNIAAVQNAINASLQSDIDAQLGQVTVAGQAQGILTGLRFNISQVSLPSNVQEAVNQAQAAFAQVSQQQALVQQAQLQAQANAAKQAGYNACSACQVIDELKALPPNLTTYAPGAGGIAIAGK